MTEEAKSHELSTSLVEAVPPQVESATDIALKVKVSCSSGCDLRGRTVNIIAEDAAVKAVELTEFDGTVNETDRFVVKAPPRLKEYMWTAVFAAQENDGVLHEESSTSFSFIVKPHATSIEVWDVPDVVALGAEFRVKVGVKCSAECTLAGKEIEVYDHQGAKVATGMLGDVPWSDTSALYWVEVELEAPGIERRYRWTIKFPEPESELPHGGASCTFAFGAVRASEHVVTVEAIDKDTRAPIKNARVVLLPPLYRGSAFRSRTDERGVAKLEVPKGAYTVHVSGDGKESTWPVVTVDRDVTVRTELSVLVRHWWED